MDPWSWLIAALGFLAWVAVVCFFLLAVLGLVILLFAVLVGFYQGIKQVWRK